MTPTTPIELRTRLDAPRGPDPWNGGERSTLRAMLTREGAFNHGEARWLWYRNCTDGKLRSERAGAWDCNDIDGLAVIEWEQARRKIGVSDGEVMEWLGLS